METKIKSQAKLMQETDGSSNIVKKPKGIEAMIRKFSKSQQDQNSERNSQVKDKIKFFEKFTSIKGKIAGFGRSSSSNCVKKDSKVEQSGVENFTIAEETKNWENVELPLSNEQESDDDGIKEIFGPNFKEHVGEGEARYESSESDIDEEFERIYRELVENCKNTN